MKNILKSALALVLIVAFGFGTTAKAFTIGQRGTDVSDLQAKLIESGFDIPAITNGSTSFGYFGKQTQSALLAYQASTEVAPVKLGAVSGPDIFSPYVNFNGIVYNYRNMAFRLATTTPCAFLSPTSTTTMRIATVQVTTGTTTDLVLTVAKATSPYATTTLISTFLLSSGLQLATTTSAANSTNASANIVSPNTYVVLGIAGIPGSNVSTSAIAGTCQAEFLTL